MKADAAQVRAVGNAEVVKRTKQALIERLPETHLRRDPVIEPVQDLPAICPLGRRGESDEHLRLQMPKQPPICVGLRVVELVDDNDVETLRIERIQSSVQRLDRGEDVVPSLRPLGGDEALAEVGLVKDQLEDLLALFKDLVSMGDEEPTVEPCARSRR